MGVYKEVKKFPNLRYTEELDPVTMGYDLPGRPRDGEASYG